MKNRILVTAAGGALAPLNIRLMKQSRHSGVWVLGVDSRTEAVGRYFADAFALVPAGGDPGYVDSILALIERHRIDIVLPWSDEEALALAGGEGADRGGRCSSRLRAARHAPDHERQVCDLPLAAASGPRHAILREGGDGG